MQQSSALPWPAAGAPAQARKRGRVGLYLDEIGACGMVVARISPWILCSGAREVSAGRGCRLGFFWGSHGPTGSQPLSCVAPAWVHRLRRGLAYCALACAARTEGIWQPYPAKPPRQGGCPGVVVCVPLSEPTRVRARRCNPACVSECVGAG